MTRIRPLIFTIATLLLMHCIGDATSGSGRYGEVLRAIATNVGLTHYVEVAHTTGDLAAATETLCQEPTEANLLTAQDAWWSAREPWRRAEIIRFGPTIDYPLRLGPKMDVWPVNPSAVEEMIEGDEPLASEDFANKGGAKRGFPVIEYLLWGVEPEGTLEALSADPRRCQAVAGASADLATNAELLRDAWEEEWISYLGDPALHADGPYADHQEVLDEWVNRMAFTVENIRITKLGKPNGDASGGLPQPDIIESPYSKRSFQDARDALRGVRDVWTGEVGEGTDGIRDLVRSFPVIQLIDESLQDAEDALAGLTGDLDTVIVDDPESITAAQEPLRLLQVAIQLDLAEALDTTLAFNDADGD